MENEQITPELERLLESVKLKEPPPELMADYLTGVNTKIDQGGKGVHFGFPQLAVLFAAGLALAGVLFFVMTKQSPPHLVPLVEQAVEQPKAVSPTEGAAQTVSKTLSLEEEMAVLEAFGEESGTQAGELMGDDELLQELSVLDELELSAPRSAQSTGV